jgi:hypothetical protein
MVPGRELSQFRPAHLGFEIPITKHLQATPDLDAQIGLDSGHVALSALEIWKVN